MSTLKNLLNSSIAIYVEYVLGFIISIIIARSLGPSQYGVYAFYIWVIALFIMFAKNGISTGIIKFLAESRGNDEIGSLNNIYSYFRRFENRVLIFITLFITLLGPFLWDKIFPELDVLMIIPLIISAYIKALYMFLVSTAKGLSRFDILSRVVVIVGPINLSLVLILVLIDGNINEFILAYTITSIVYLVVIRFYIIKELKYSSSISLPIKTKTRINSHVLLVSFNMILGFIIFKQSEIAFLNYFGTKEDIAFYNIGYLLASGFMELIPGVYIAILLPLVAKINATDKDNMPLMFNNSTRYLFILMAPVLFLGIFFSSEIIHIIYGSEYSKSVLPFIFSLISGAIIVISQTGISYLVSIDKQRDLLKLLAVTATLNIIMDYILVEKYLLHGAIVANLIANSIYSFSILYMATSKLKVQLNYLTFMKILSLSIISLLPVMAIDSTISNKIVSILVGTFIFFIFFSVLTIIMRCWTKDELSTIRNLLIKAFKSKHHIFTNAIDKKINNKHYLINK